MTHQVFISHSNRDAVTADAVCRALEGRGVRCWIAPRDVAIGSDYAEVVAEAVENSAVMVLILSAAANTSRHVKREVRMASERDTRIVQLRVGTVDLSGSLKYHLQGQQYLDAGAPPLDRHIERPVVTVAQLLGATATSERPASSHAGAHAEVRAEARTPERLSEPVGTEQRRPPESGAGAAGGSGPTVPPKNSTNDRVWRYARASAVLEELRPHIVRLDQRRREDAAASLTAGWAGVEGALRIMVGVPVHDESRGGQALVSDVRAAGLLDYPHAHALLGFLAARDRATRPDYQPTAEDVAVARAGFEAIKAANDSAFQAIKAANNPVPARSLRCGDCGTMNYSTEGQCDKCGGELAVR